MKKILITLLLPALLLPLKAQMQQAVDKIAKDHKLMGLSVTVVCDGKIAGSFQTGMRDYDRSLPVTADTKYRIASISKLVMTTAMMKLCDEGRLDLDEDAGRYLGFALRNPHFPDTPITVRMLLLHTGSINEGRGYDTFLDATYNNVGEPPSFTELLLPGGGFYSDDMWREEPPGAFYSYCNANFGLAGTIIEKITGERFEEYMQRTLFRPLGITGSYIVEGISDLNNLAVIYRSEDDRWVPQTDNFQGANSASRDFSGYTTGTNAAVYSPQGGLRISADELARVMILHLNEGRYNREQIVSKESIRLMHGTEWSYDRSLADDEDDVRYGSRGLSIQILPEALAGGLLPPGSHMMGHTGSAYGLISDFFFDPVRKFGFIFITNGMAEAPRKGESGSFYAFEEELIKALRANALLPCTKQR